MWGHSTSALAICEDIYHTEDCNRKIEVCTYINRFKLKEQYDHKIILKLTTQPFELSLLKD